MDHPLTPPAVRPARVVLAGDDCLFRASLRQLLEAPPIVIADVYGVAVAPGFEVVAEAADGDEAARVLQTIDADLVVLDLCMPVMSGVAALTRLSRDAGRPPVIVLAGAVSRSQLAEAIRLGVHGLVLKSAPADVLLKAIRWVLEGRCWLDSRLVTDLIETARQLMNAAPQAHAASPRLTRREREVLGLVVAGYANKEIAQASSVTEDSVKHHLTRIYEKLGVSNRVELATFAAEHSLLES
jgi:two-component system, NarL family, nitrate/nitrite response regulator NarL